MLVRGKMNKQIAHALGITERTIKAHRQRIFDKLGAQTIADLYEGIRSLAHQEARKLDGLRLSLQVVNRMNEAKVRGVQQHAR